MAHDNVDTLINGLNDAAVEALEFVNGGELGKLIDTLEDLANASAGFGGKIAQICPSKIRAQKDALSNINSQLRSVATNVTKELDELVDVLENMPLKDLRSSLTSLRNARDKINTELGNVDNNGVVPQAPVNIPGAPSNGPKSAIVQHESTVWNSIKGGFGSLRESNNYWNAIKSNVDALDIDVSETTTPQEPQSLFESIIASGLPKNAGDINSRPDPRVDYNAQYSSVLPGEPMQESVQEMPVQETEHMVETAKYAAGHNAQSIKEESKELFSQEVSTTSLKEALNTFKDTSDFDISNWNLDEVDNGDSLEGHVLEGE